jgi:hypothetical protein
MIFQRTRRKNYKIQNRVMPRDIGVKQNATRARGKRLRVEASYVKNQFKNGF